MSKSTENQRPLEGSPLKKSISSVSRRHVLGVGASAAAAAALPGVLRTSVVHAAAVDPSWEPKFLSAEQGLAVATLCDLILPETATPSATQAGVHEYIDEALSVADADEQLEFLGGLAFIEQRARKTSSDGFLSLTEKQQIALLEEISDDKEPSPDLKAGAAFFTDLKRRTLFGYYTSKIGRTAALGLPDSVKREKFVGCTHGPGAHKG